MKKAQARELARDALEAAIREDWEVASAKMNEIGAHPLAMGVALLAWCDTAIAEGSKITGQELPVAGGPEVGYARPVWLNPETGRLITDADAVRPGARWAGRLIAARAAMDHVQVQVLIGTMPGDGWTRGEYAGELLTGCAGMAKLAATLGGES